MHDFFFIQIYKKIFLSNSRNMSGGVVACRIWDAQKSVCVGRIFVLTNISKYINGEFYKAEGQKRNFFYIYMLNLYIFLKNVYVQKNGKFCDAMKNIQQRKEE
jgi:hypothetical protein